MSITSRQHVPLPILRLLIHTFVYYIIYISWVMLLPDSPALFSIFKKKKKKRERGVLVPLSSISLPQLPAPREEEEEEERKKKGLQVCRPFPSRQECSNTHLCAPFLSLYFSSCLLYIQNLCVIAVLCVLPDFHLLYSILSSTERRELEEGGRACLINQIGKIRKRDGGKPYREKDSLASPPYFFLYKYNGFLRATSLRHPFSTKEYHLPFTSNSSKNVKAMKHLTLARLLISWAFEQRFFFKSDKSSN